MHPQCGNFRIFLPEILREINFKDYKSPKMEILEVSKALNFVLGKFQHSKIAKNVQNLTSEP